MISVSPKKEASPTITGAIRVAQEMEREGDVIRGLEGGGCEREMCMTGEHNGQEQATRDCPGYSGHRGWQEGSLRGKGWQKSPGLGLVQLNTAGALPPGSGSKEGK